ncbi:Cryptochrome-2 [Symbiodinium microadriaticum]|uniref:Cryptochrome-2 n=1 Tax=Symbiodinium microadriaticum TaxID=2951 RepID=A0A1Q9DT06_SYMMI|nr:Cryptochrome-2 [Symbiodinium microadriaticum]
MCRVTKLKEERISEEDTLKAAEVQRGKEWHEHYVEEHTEDTQVVEQISQAQQALKTGSSAALLQKAPMLRAAERRLAASEKQRLVSFLSGERMDPSYVLGILSGMADDTKEEIATDDKNEDTAIHTYDELEDSKKVEISTLLEQFERKMKRIGELKVEVVNMKKSMEGAGQSLADDKKMLKELQSTCEAKAAAWEERQATRQKELSALQETVKILDSDESLDLFRGKASSLLQLSKGDQDKKDKALELVLKARSEAHPELNFLALALSGRKIDFSKIVKKIDGMVELLKTEGKDDASKKDYCGKEFHEAELKTKSVASTITSLTATVEQSKGAIAQLATEIKGLQAGLVELDKTVAEAGENRKAEHEDFQELLASNGQAVQLLDLAKNKLNQFYSPSQFVDTTTKNPFDPYAFLQSSSRKVEAPPATFEGGYQAKMSESHGIFSLIAQLKADIEQEMALAKSDEANSQKDYEKTLADAAEKRDADVTLTQEKAKTKADLETDLSDDKSELSNKKKEATVVEEVVSNLHKECDWLLEHFDLRAQARAEEKENLVQAKTVLSSMCSTGFPLVDAAMRQLWAVGWMPNYLRHVVAQMLIEYLDLTWKHGLEWFDWTLVDIDVAINSFMWQNGGHSGPDHWEFVLHPVNAAKSCDPEGHYVRRWLPFLAGCPTEYIHRSIPSLDWRALLHEVLAGMQGSGSFNLRSSWSNPVQLSGGSRAQALLEPSPSSRPATTVPADFQTPQEKASPSALGYTPERCPSSILRQAFREMYSEARTSPAQEDPYGSAPPIECLLLGKHWAVAADIARGLGEPGVVILGLVHILVYNSYIKVGRSDDMTPQLLRRLTKYRQHSMADEARLAFPSIYVATSGEQASLLEGFRYMHMSANHPNFRLDLPTDTISEVGREKYDRRALHILVAFMEFGSTRTVDQISAGRTVLRPWEMPLRVARPLGLPKLEPLVRDLDAARRAHCRQVLEVRRKHPEMVSRTGHEWLRLGGGLLAKLVTRQEFRAETEDFIFYQGPRQKGSKGGSKGAGLDAGRSVLAEEVQKHESDTFGPGL